jgi:mitochondrial import receptor subunit TOM40
VELGTEIQALLVGPRRDVSATVAAKFDYRQACIRAQADTIGRVGMVYEERIFPGFSLLLSGELDHLRSASRFGFGINMEN